jgi:hypothetical protein
MAEEKKFAELVNEAPLATAEKTVSLTGLLARSQDRGKFVLTTGDNQKLTLDVDAVKEYKVLSGMVGQTVVQVEVDRDKVPASLIEGGAEPIRTLPVYDFPRTTPVTDIPHTHPITDFRTIPVVDEMGPKYIIENTGTIQENVVDPGGNIGNPVYGAAAPFAFATAQQAPPSALGQAEMLQPFRTYPHIDLRTLAYWDKPPLTDITGHFPYPD